MIWKKRRFWIGVLVMILISGPYLFAFQQAGQDWFFGGFLLNPVDGHSYLAKMQEGYAGSWRFVLPYTAEPGQGAYLFLLYIVLGQAARVLDLPPLGIFHAARLMGSIFLMGAVWKLISGFFEEERIRDWGFAVVMLGSGLGWLGILGGMFTSDFWVAEAYPFLSMYANPHFPLGLGLLILALLPGSEGFFKQLGLAAALALVQPFLVVSLLLIRLISFILDLTKERSRSFQAILASPKFLGLVGLGLGGGSWLLYQYASILADPVLRGWNDQNLTPAPGLGDFLLSFSPVLVLAVWGIKQAWRTEQGRKIVIWAGSGLVLLLIPWNLQRRFMAGLYVPLAVLAVLGLKTILQKWAVSQAAAFWLLFLLVIPSNLIVMLAGMGAAASLDRSIMVQADLDASLEWIAQNTPPRALILGDETAGLLIPSQTGRRVLYGHPFETVPAAEELKLVREIYQGSFPESAASGLLEQRGVGYILISSSPGGSPPWPGLLEGFPTVYENSTWSIKLVSP